MKVAHVTTVDLSLRYLLLNQLVFLAQAGYEVTGISSPGPHVEVVRSAGIRHVAVPMSRRVTPFADLVSLARLVRVLRRERFTIVHTHTPKPGLLGQLAATVVRTPLVVNTVHGFYFHDMAPGLARRSFVAMERLAARCSDRILSQSREDVALAVRLGICPPEKIRHLGNGIDLTVFEPSSVSPAMLAARRAALGIPAASPVVGFVGRLVAEKGLLELLEAMALLRRRLPDVRLVLVGPEDPEKPDAVSAATAAEKGVADLCVFTGLRHDLPELYALMDVFVLPSHREGVPRAPMEASAMGVPCVVTDVRGCREVVERGHNGILVPVGDAEALAAAIESVLTDPEAALRMGEAGRRLAEERFDERRVFETVQETYERLLEEKGLCAPPTSNLV